MWVVKSIYGDFFTAKTKKSLAGNTLKFVGVSISDADVYYIRENEIAKIYEHKTKEEENNEF